MKKIKSYKSIGLVSLEAAAVFSVMMPIIFIIVGASAYYYMTFKARNIAENSLFNIDAPTFVLGGGHQDFFLHADGQAVKELAEESLFRINNYLAAQMNRIPGAVACAEIGYIAFFVQEQSGRALEISKITYNGDHQLNYGFYPERRSPQCASFTTNVRRIFQNTKRDIEDGGASFSTIFSIASGLKGARLQADYGPSNIYDNSRGLTHSNVHGASEYLRETAVIGSSVIIDLRRTSIGRMMTAMFWSEDQLVIEVNKIYSPRIDF